jgi:glycosyltransferase involved in cell wall biosynthesis
LVLALPDWRGDYMKPTVALTRELARTHPVLYVEHPRTWATAARQMLGDDGDPVSTTARLRAEPTDHGAPVHVLAPPIVWPMNALPAALYDRVLQRNARRVAKEIQSALDALGLRRPLVLNALNPHYGVALAGAFNERARVYFCYDEVRARDWNGRHGGRMEDRYLPQVDAVVGTSPALHERLDRQHPNAHLVPNGVDFALFHRAVTDTAPTDRETSGRPCVGFVGSLDERLDYDLLHATIEAHPEWDVRFVGRVMVDDARALAAHSHVTFTGPQPPDALPRELARMNVGLMPFAKTAFTRNMYPCKVNEYLAAGLPVVSTRFAPLPDVEDLVAFADTPDAFAAAIADAVSPVDAATAAEQRQTRVDRARAHRWERRAEALCTVLDAVADASTEPERPHA